MPLPKDEIQSRRADYTQIEKNVMALRKINQSSSAMGPVDNSLRLPQINSTNKNLMQKSGSV